MIDRLLNILLCLEFAAVLGVSWGLIVGLVDLQAGIWVGNSLFFVALLFFIRKTTQYDKEFNEKVGERDVAAPMEGKAQ